MRALHLNIDSMVNVIRTALIVMSFSLGLFTESSAQTAANTPVRNEAKALYQFRSRPADTVRTNTVIFTVLDAPNFELRIGNRDTLTFGKDTVVLRFVYTNVGNKTADSAVVQGILPPAGMRFVPGSTGGTIDGGTVSWLIRNIAAGASDSVKVKVVVDSTLVVNTQLQMQADISWQSSSVTASRTFVIATLPKLALNIVPLDSVVGSGRSTSFRIVVSNIGNTAALSTVVYDTISALGAYVSSSPAADSLSASKRLVKWQLGSVQAFSTRSITVTLGVEANNGHAVLSNAAVVNASNIPERVPAANSLPIVPILPKSIAITPDPEFIFGQAGKDSSRITVIVKDSTGALMPDGTPVQFTTSLGTFSNGSTAVAASVINGMAIATLRSFDVSNDILPARIDAVAGVPSIGTVHDTASVHFYPGAVTGIVVNGIVRVPFAGAIARVSNSIGAIIGADTTGIDGRFFVPLRKDVAKYTLEILVIDKFGDTIRTNSDIDPTRFPLPPIVIPNIISGRIEYKVTGQPVPAKNVRVFLDSLGVPPSIRPNRNARNRPVLSQLASVRVRQSVTDEKGKFKFENLKPAKYVISLDSVEFPNFNAFTFLTDTASGTFTINLSLQVVLDSAITFTAQAPPTVNAGDTLKLSLRIGNEGTAEHRSITLTDTLSPYVSFVSAEKGSFAAATFDSLTRIVQWTRDTLRPLSADSVVLHLAVAQNIPDRTQLRNRVWFASNIRTQSAAAPTTVRSIGQIVFDNAFIMPNDTIVAGDSILHVFRFRNIGTDSLRNIRIVDTLFSAGTVGISMPKGSHDSLRVIDSISTIYIDALAPGARDSVTQKLLTDFALRNGTTVASHAYVMKDDSILAMQDIIFVVNEHPNLPSFLSIVKSANKKVAEIGDIVTYQVQINNQSPQGIRSIGVYDMLPYAFRYVRNSARFNGRPVEPFQDRALNQLTWSIPDTIPASKSVTLVYQLAIGADAMESEGLNTAYASATAGAGTVLVSSASQWQVTVRPGVFSEKGLIIGKVFYDDDRNTFQDAGESGVKGIELWMEDGTRITTGDDGKFSLPEVKPGQHVLRVNERTLPPQISLLPGNNAFANDPVSRFVRVTEGGIAKANFYLKRTLSDSIQQTIAKVNKLIVVRQVKPKYLYEDTLRRMRMDTVTMFVSFNYSGNRALGSLVISDKLDERFTIVPGSATFNGKRINPITEDGVVRWKVGEGPAAFRGVVRYKAVIGTMPPMRTRLLSYSTVSAMSVDSIMVETSKARTENEVVDTMRNRIETSDMTTATSDPRLTNHLSDSVSLYAGDEAYFKTSLFIDPRKKVTEARIVDSIPSVFIVSDRTVSVNGVPVPLKNMTTRIRSLALSSASRMPGGNEELDFLRITSIDLTELLRGGRNEITYSARLQHVKRDTMYQKHTFATVIDDDGDTTFLHSRNARILVHAGNASMELPLETTYVDIPRPTVRVEEKVVEAVKLVESLRSGGTSPVVMEGITFELSKATLTGDSKVVLDNIAQLLLKNGDIRIQINGYTDNTGNAAANRKMSLNRAKEVALYLISKGIASDRLLPQGYGPANPIASNKTEEGRAKNRRVEFAPLH